MQVFWPALIGGLVCIAIGAILIINKSRAAQLNADAQKATFGKLSKQNVKNSTPNKMLYNGAGIICVGIVGIVLSLLDLNW